LQLTRHLRKKVVSTITYDTDPREKKKRGPSFPGKKKKGLDLRLNQHDGKKGACEGGWGKKKKKEDRGGWSNAAKGTTRKRARQGPVRG